MISLFPRTLVIISRSEIEEVLEDYGRSLFKED